MQDESEGRRSQKRAMKDGSALEVEDACVSPDAVRSLLTRDVIDGLGSSTNYDRAWQRNETQQAFTPWQHFING